MRYPPEEREEKTNNIVNVTASFGYLFLGIE
jgi:hypothetical protein